VAYDGLLKEGLADENRKEEAEVVLRTLLESLGLLAKEVSGVQNGDASGPTVAERVKEKVGEVLGSKIVEANNLRLITAVLQADLNV
jgi:transcription initiation factor TFIID subunit 6